MIGLFVKSASIAAVLFAAGAIWVPDPVFVRFLGFASFVMACLLLSRVSPLVPAALTGPATALNVFLIGLCLINLAWVYLRGVGLLIRDFNFQWLVTSNLFSLAFALTIFGQSFKIAAIEAIKGKAVSGWVIAREVALASMVGCAMTVLFGVMMP